MKKAEFVCCGHHPLIVFDRNSGDCREIKPRGIPLGIMRNVGYDKIQIELKSGLRFLVYTDGLVESTNKNGEDFGIENLLMILKLHPEKNPWELCSILRNYSRQWGHGKRQEDDIAFLIVDIP